MTVRATAAILFSVFAMAFSPMAHTQSDEVGATAHRLMIRSGMSVQLRGFTGQIEAAFKQYSGKVDERILAALLEAAKEAYRPDLLQDDMTRRLAKKLTADDMENALTWLETDVGQRITQSEEVASAALDEQRLQGYAERLKSKPLAVRRAQLIAGLISATSALRAAAAMQEDIAMGVATGMDSMQPKERRVGEAGLRATVRKALSTEQVQQVLAQQMPVMFAYTYRNISDADLVGYVAFLNSVAGKRYQDAMNGTLIEGLGRASVQLGELTGQRLRQTSM